MFNTRVRDSAFMRRLAQNSPMAPMAAPLFIGQGLSDDLVFPVVQDAYVATRCAAGQRLLYKRYDGLDHLSLVAPDSALSADLLAWSRARLAGEDARSNCPE
jgi:alpha-beta hydrolase superfamily lysophospholipase